MMQFKPKLLVHVAVLTALIGAGQAHAAAITLTTPGAEYGGGLYTLGFEFTVSSNTTVTSLGIYDSGRNGLSSSSRVGLWDTSGNLLTSATVLAGTAAELDGYFRYVDIAGFNLVAGTHYVIGSYTTDLASSFNLGQGGSGSVDSRVTVIQDRYSNFDSAFSYADTSTNQAGAWLGANFRWQPVQVPEPGSLALVGLSLFALMAAGRRRG